MPLHRKRGFTLLEVLVTLTILGILVAVAAAGFREYVVRAAIAEGFAFADAARTGVIESLAMGARPSTVSTSAGGPTGHHIAVDWHEGTSAGLQGYLLANADLPLLGHRKAFALELREGGNWYCVDAAPYAAAGEALAPRFLPATCRDGAALPVAPVRATSCGPNEEPVSVSAPGGGAVAACAPKCPPGQRRAAAGGAACHPDPASPVAPAPVPPGKTAVAMPPLPTPPGATAASPATAAVATTATPSATAPPPAASTPPVAPGGPACPDGQYMEADRVTGLPTGNCRDWSYGGGRQVPSPGATCNLGNLMPVPKGAAFKAITCDPMGGDGFACAGLPPDPAADSTWVKNCNPGELPYATVKNGADATQELERGCMSVNDCRNVRKDIEEEACQKHSMSTSISAAYSCTYCCVGDGCNGGDTSGGGCAVQPGTLPNWD